MSQRPQEHFRRGLPTEHGRVRRVLDYEAGEGTCRQQHPPLPPHIQRPWSCSRYPQQSMILLQPRGSIGASSGASDVAKNSRTRTSTTTLRGPRRTKRYVSLGGARGGPATRIFLQPRTVGTNMCPQVVEESEKKATSNLVGLVPWRKRRRRSSVSAVVEESDGESEGDGPEVPRGSRGHARGRG